MTVVEAAIVVVVPVFSLGGDDGCVEAILGEMMRFCQDDRVPSSLDKEKATFSYPDVICVGELNN